ncbi:WD40 repeat-like protein [Clavulina sp. PMI_390]|nr:WD40 repeat-like protein [Clavulina sp. PMI_390]
MLKMDILSSLPPELALHTLTFVPVATVLQATLVNRYWHELCETQVLWKSFCDERSWRWKHRGVDALGAWRRRPEVNLPVARDLAIDEGFNDGEMETPTADTFPSIPSGRAGTGHRILGSQQSLGETDNTDDRLVHSAFVPDSKRHTMPALATRGTLSGPAVHVEKPDYKLLYRTRTILARRLQRGQSSLTVITAPTVRATLPANFTFHPNGPGQGEQSLGHTSTIYALCLANDALTGERTLFTASRDRTILQWRLPNPSSSSSASLASFSGSQHSPPSFSRSLPIRVFQGAHQASVLSICVAPEYGFLISGGSDGRIVVWDMATGTVVKVLADPEGHNDTVLCVRCDDRRLVSCSKDKTVRTFLLPSLRPHLVLESHRAAVNALALSEGLIASASGDRSLRIWDADTGDLLHVYDGHHARGLASIDFAFPYVVTGSSDRQIHYFDVSTGRGWTTEAVTLPRPRVGGAGAHAAGEEPEGEAPIVVNLPTASTSTAPSTSTSIHRAPWPAALWNAPKTVMRYSAQAMKTWEGLMWRSARMGMGSVGDAASLRSPASACQCQCQCTAGSGSITSGLGRLTLAVPSTPTLAHAAATNPNVETCPMCGGAGHLSAPLSPHLHAHAHPHHHSGPQSQGGLLPNSAEMQRVESNAPLERERGHGDLVRAVVMNDEVVVSGSYDATIKVWDRRTGAFLADYSHGHDGRVFGLAMDCTKIVSCGEDERICIWVSLSGFLHLGVRALARVCGGRRLRPLSHPIILDNSG